MASSPSHKFGQIIGNLLEEIIFSPLREFYKERGLYLDTQGDRKARSGKKVTWEDKYGNMHDLDYVIEKGGTPDIIGKPVAFIEVAWRRYTKHSKNKAQEIQGAVLPIAELYKWDQPFLGTVVAGEFTAPSIEQLKSVGFETLYFPYESIVSAFSRVGINVRFDEETPDAEFGKCIESIEKLSKEKSALVKQSLIEQNQLSIDIFFEKLKISLDKDILFVSIIPLYGLESKFSTISEAAKFIENFTDNQISSEFQKFEVIIRYSNGDSINASFKDKAKALQFLKHIGGV